MTFLSFTAASDPFLISLANEFSDYFTMKKNFVGINGRSGYKKFLSRAENDARASVHGSATNHAAINHIRNAKSISFFIRSKR